MIFTHDFAADLDTLIAGLEAGRPFAFTKFADGERLILDGVEHHLRKPFEEWDSGGDGDFRMRLFEAITCTLDGFHVGISCPCCSDSSGYKHGVPDYAYYRRLVRLPPERVTFANIFVNGNYTRWQHWLSARSPDVCLVSSSAASPPQFRVPKNAVNADWGLDGLVSRILDDDHTAPVFVAAGPAGSIIVHEVWRQRQDRIVVDVGSTLDPLIHGAHTRGYHDQNHPNRKKVCQWNSLAHATE